MQPAPARTLQRGPAARGTSMELAGGHDDAISRRSLEEGSLEASYLSQPPPTSSSEQRTLSGERWVPDAEAPRCDACTEKFGFWRRRVRPSAPPATARASPPGLAPHTLRSARHVARSAGPCRHRSRPSRCSVAQQSVDSCRAAYCHAQHHCRRCGNVFCASCSIHRICFRYQTTDVQSSDDEEEDGAPEVPLPDAGDDTEDVYGSPQRVCDHCFYCSILAPLVEWAYGRPMEGFSRSEELEMAVEHLTAVTTSETAEWICRPVPNGEAEAAALDVEAALGTELPPMATLMQWAKVLLELDRGLAALCAQVKSSRLMPEPLFWVRYFASVHDELNWGGEDDQSDEISDEDEEQDEEDEQEHELGKDEDDYEDADADDDDDDGGGGGQQMQHVHQLPPPNVGQQHGQQRGQQRGQRRQQLAIASFPLKQAMKDQDTPRILELVHDSRTANSILDVHKRFTVLHVAVLQDNTPVIEHLLKHGAHTDPLSVHGVTPLFAAVARGKLRAVQLLIGAGANVNLPAGNGDLPVQHAEARARAELEAAHGADAVGEGFEPEPEPELDDGDDGGGDDGEGGGGGGGGGGGADAAPQYAEVAQFLRAIYEEKAEEMGGDMTSDALIERMAMVWNQRRQKHAAAMRQQQQQQQQRQAQMQARGTGDSGGAGAQVTGPAAVAARKQAVLDAAQAKAKAHRRHQEVLAEIRSPEAAALSPPVPRPELEPGPHGGPELAPA